jgi:predicted small metal-binding protein
MEKVKCSELGILDCDFTATGETAGDVVEQVVEHLNEEHDLDMPDADMILTGKVDEGTLKMLKPAAVLVIERLTEALNLIPLRAPEKPKTPPFAQGY